MEIKQDQLTPKGNVEKGHGQLGKSLGNYEDLIHLYSQPSLT